MGSSNRVGKGGSKKPEAPKAGEYNPSWLDVQKHGKPPAGNLFPQKMKSKTPMATPGNSGGFISPFGPQVPPPNPQSPSPTPPIPPGPYEMGTGGPLTPAPGTGGGIIPNPFFPGAGTPAPEPIPQPTPTTGFNNPDPGPNPFFPGFGGTAPAPEPTTTEPFLGFRSDPTEPSLFFGDSAMLGSTGGLQMEPVPLGSTGGLQMEPTAPTQLIPPTGYLADTLKRGYTYGGY